MFTVEALRAQHGDCLLVHFGEPVDPNLILIDGGPSRTYRETLRPRLEALREERGLAALPLELIMVSHLDEDHIEGLLRMCQALVKGPLDGLQIEPKTLWHNTFAEQKLAADEAADDDDAVNHLNSAGAGGQELGVVVSSIGQSENLQELVRALGWSVNKPFTGMVRADGPDDNHVSFDGLELTVVAPNADQLAKLHDEWPEDIHALARLEEDPDDSPFNLASIVCLLEAEGKRALMTGDALGSDVLTALETAGLVEPGASLELDLLKVPHHGSSRNATPEFFERLPAEHYVISADGKNSNPDFSTLEMLLEARRDDAFTLHLTYRDLIEPAGSAPIDYLENQKRSGREFGLEYRAPEAFSLAIALAQ